MGVLRAVIQVFVLPVLGCRHGGAVCDPIRSELVGDQNPRLTALLLQNFPEEPGCGFTVPLGLDQNVENIPVLIDRPPQVLSDSADLDEGFVELSRITTLRLMSAQSAGVFGPEFRTPGADRLVRQRYSTGGHE
jgi:hypothetical protein